MFILQMQTARVQEMKAIIHISLEVNVLFR